jgi:hypothetical protein
VAGINPRSAVIVKTGTGVANVAGTNNFFLTGSSVSPLANTKFASDVLFTDASANNFTLQATSPAVGYASGSVTPTPAWRFNATPTSGGLLAGKISARTITTNLGALQ